MYLGINKKFGFPSRVDKYILKEKYSYPKDMEEMKKKVKMFFESLEEKEIEVTIIPCQSQMIELAEILKNAIKKNIKVKIKYFDLNKEEEFYQTIAIE
jgi:hypothetical protein